MLKHPSSPKHGILFTVEEMSIVSRDIELARNLISLPAFDFLLISNYNAAYDSRLAVE